MKTIGAMLDCSRDGVYTVKSLKCMFRILAQMGYNAVQLYTEDVYEIEGEPYFGYLRGRYSKSELKELNAYAGELGLELIPCIQTFAHLGGITRWEEYKPYTDIDDILLAGDERTYRLIEGMFQTCAECFTSRRMNIGMDEAHMVGLGKYLSQHGYQNRFDILLAHIKRVNEIAEKYGFSLMMWSDMFFRLANDGKYTGELPENILSLVPKNVSLVYWNYYSTEKEYYDKMIQLHQRFPNRIAFASGAWSWIGFVPSNCYAILSNEAAIRSCSENGVEDIFITCWKDDGAESSLFSILPTLMCVAEFAHGNFDREKIAKRFHEIVGIEFTEFLKLDNVNLTGKEVEYPCNPSKYMLYSDPFLGIFDDTCKEGGGKQYADVRNALLCASKNGEYGYLFRTLAELCSVLELKYELGLETRKVYAAKDKAKLNVLVEKYDDLVQRVDRFYSAFRYQWEKECKLYGFEKHDIRLGGLICRVKHCREILQQYIDGVIDRIEPLEEKILPFSKTTQSARSTLFNVWSDTAMIKKSPL